MSALHPINNILTTTESKLGAYWLQTTDTLPPTLPGNSCGDIEVVDLGGKNRSQGTTAPLVWFRVTVPAQEEVPSLLSHNESVGIWQVFQAMPAAAEQIYLLNPADVLYMTPLDDDELLGLSDTRELRTVPIRGTCYSSHDGAYLSDAQVAALEKFGMLEHRRAWSEAMQAVVEAVK